MDSPLHSNPWADRLLQVSMPDIGEAWLAMESVLDREMPRHGWKDWKRWLLLILLLLLLIGVCHCPGPVPGRLSVSGPVSGSVPGSVSRSVAGPPALGGSTRLFRDSGITDAAQQPKPIVREDSSRKKAPPPKGKDTSDSGKGSMPPPSRKDTSESRKRSMPPPSRKDSSQSGKRSMPPPKGQDTTESRKKRTPPPVEKKDKDAGEKGLMAGIGLNQFFPLGDQQSPYNSSGITGTITDYLPVPMLRYYFNHKLYLQLEAQINTPQAAKKGGLVISSPPRDSLAATQQYAQHTTSIQQLFYFNVPLSVHYRVWDNLDLGAGLQFSRLNNAIGAFDTSTWNINGPPDTVDTKAVRTLKGDPLFQQIRTNEFRILFDLNYTYKRAILGIRYNQALSPYVRVQIAPGQITQSRNSSLQLYLRYILWDGRKSPAGNAVSSRAGPDKD